MVTFFFLAEEYGAETEGNYEAEGEPVQDEADQEPVMKEDRKETSWQATSVGQRKKENSSNAFLSNRRNNDSLLRDGKKKSDPALSPENGA